MRAFEYSQMLPMKWSPLTWIVVGLFLAYAIVRNSPAESIEPSPLEVRNLTNSFIHEAQSYSTPLGWPMLCIRPVNGFFWDADFQAGNVGPALPVEKTSFFISVFLLNVALIVLNALAIVYLIQFKLVKFSIRALLSLTVICAVFLVAWSHKNFLFMWNGADTLIILACFLPLLVAGPLAYYLFFTYEPYKAPEPGQLSHAQVPTVKKQRQSGG